MKKISIVFLTGLTALFVSCTKGERTVETTTSSDVTTSPTTADRSATTTTTTSRETTVVDDAARGTSTGSAPTREGMDTTADRNPQDRNLTPPKTLPHNPSIHESSDAGTRHGHTDSTTKP